ncbi:hypothetical protein [Limibacillus halophilus]|uniref:Anti-sigma factor RsiW n=1 Tax=Limibacillus halophilus TaxID=1579333 RepID=A0A839SSZ0_9PROT|nr:hypothetical protein [Limibacillus halophilus]MBB3064830.1 anti-sigma factor RsiW [Limibacillus halophilus]
MTSDDRKDLKEGAALWLAAKEAWREPKQDGSQEQTESLDPLTVAAYLDGALEGDELEAVEGVLARNPALLEEVLALSALEPEAAPVSLTLRAQGLVRAPSIDEAPVKGGMARRFMGWFDPSRWTQTAAWASVAAAMLLAWGLAFELGFSGLEAVAAVDELAARDFLIAPASDETLL